MGEKEQTNKHGLGSAPSARKGVCDNLHPLCICRLSRACILRETSIKATRNANSYLTVFPHCLLLLTVLPLDCYLKPTVLLCSPLSTGSLCLPLSTDPLSSMGPSFPRPHPLSQEVSPLGPLCGFRAKADKEILWPAHTPNTTNDHIVSHTVITSLQSEELKTFVCYSIRELPVTLEQIKQEARRDKYINNIKAKNLQRDQQTTDVFSTCDDVLLYRECLVIPSTL